MPSPKIRILLVEDHPAHVKLLRRAFEEEGETSSFLAVGSLREARRELAARPPDVLITDLRLPDGSGFRLLPDIVDDAPYPVIVLTGQGDEHTAVEAMKSGAADYVVKSTASLATMPATTSAVLEAWRRCRERRERDENALALLVREAGAHHDHELVGASRSTKEIRARIKKVARTASTVLVTGESGVGKEVVARAVHQASDRANQIFLAVNCAAIPSELLESQLFGHTRGSFSGAVGDQQGMFQAADGGTIFLDEIGELPVSLQAKLLRAIERKEVLALGASTAAKLDVRIIAATNRDLESASRRGDFREDLYYRLNVFRIHVPPLRERLEDIPPLVGHLMQKHNREMKLTLRGITKDAMAALLTAHWRGNVRELENVIEHAMILAEGDTLTLEGLPDSIVEHEGADGRSPHTTLRLAMRHYESRHIESILSSVDGDRRRAADLLGIGLSTLYKKIEELEIKDERRSLVA